MGNRGTNQRKYQANIVGATFGRSSNNNEQIAIHFEITDGPDDGLQSIAYVGTFTDRALEITEKAMRECGWEGNDLLEFKALADAGKLGPVEIVVVDETYDGKTQPKVRFINGPGGGGGRFRFREGSEIQGADLTSFAARMRSAFGQRRAAPSSSPPRGPAGGNGQRGGGFDDRQAPPPLDDDIPF